MSSEKHYYESPEFWKEGVLNDTVTNERLEYTKNAIPNDVKSIADIGCGNGVFADYMLKNTKIKNIISIDRSEMALTHVKSKKLIGDITNIPLNDNSVDLVTCLQVLEHIPNDVYRQSISELFRVSRKYIIITVPHRENIESNKTKCPECKSEFNADLHLRSYDNLSLSILFDEFNCKNIYVENIPTIDFLGIKTIEKIKNLFRKKYKHFNSPICPICNHVNDSYKIMSEYEYNLNDSFLKRNIKKYWPKVKMHGFRCIALYEIK